jgi:hypothetical protein
MIQEKDLPKLQAPSKKAIAKAALIALGLALVVLFAAILPAEYGIDPLGTGAMLGLTELAGAANAPAEPALVPPGGQPLPAATVNAQAAGYKVDSEELLLTPGRGVEIKYHMAKGAVMVYSWKASGKVLFEFHGEPDQKPNPDYYDSYELDDKVGKEQSHGWFIAPSTGIHGWFWENKGEENVEIRLTVAGFFDAAKMFSGGPPEDLPIEDPPVDSPN